MLPPFHISSIYGIVLERIYYIPHRSIQELGTGRNYYITFLRFGDVRKPAPEGGGLRV
jgi:hypothetical protein